MKENKIHCYPMKMQPVYKDYLWGGKKLKSFNKSTDMPIIAESWEVSCNEAGLTTVANGIYAGKTLKTVLESSWTDFLGEKFCGIKNFPLIVKLIDAQKDLSIQVHPSEMAADTAKGEFCKSELWYVLECEPDSYIYYGFKKDISKEEFTQSVREKNICELLNKIKVTSGEAYYIPAGTIHALGKGILVAEIQQNSNTTFRVYDYDRRDFNGNFRELHTERAKDVVNLKKTVPDENINKNFSGFECEYFKVKKEIIGGKNTFYNVEKTFSIVQFISGEGRVIDEKVSYKGSLGDTFFIPAKLRKYSVVGDCDLLITSV